MIHVVLVACSGDLKTSLFDKPLLNFLIVCKFLADARPTLNV